MTAYRNANLDKRHEYDKTFREKHHESELERQKKYREENQDKIKAYNEKNKERKSETDKKWREANKEKKKEMDRLYRENNAEKVKAKKKEYYEKVKNDPEFKEKRNNYERNRLKNDINYKILQTTRRRIQLAIKNNKKCDRSINLLGCTIEFARKHLEEKFTKEMNWNNHGKFWQIDHIIPCSYFDFSDPRQQKYCFNYKNIQPLTCEENNRKSRNKIPEGIELPVFD